MSHHSCHYYEKQKYSSQETCYIVRSLSSFVEERLKMGKIFLALYLSQSWHISLLTRPRILDIAKVQYFANSSRLMWGGHCEKFMGPTGYLKGHRRHTSIFSNTTAVIAMRKNHISQEPCYIERSLSSSVEEHFKMGKSFLALYPSMVTFLTFDPS